MKKGLEGVECWELRRWFKMKWAGKASVGWQINEDLRELRDEPGETWKKSISGRGNSKSQRGAFWRSGKSIHERPFEDTVYSQWWASLGFFGDSAQPPVMWQGQGSYQVQVRETVGFGGRAAGQELSNGELLFPRRLQRCWFTMPRTSCSLWRRLSEKQKQLQSKFEQMLGLHCAGLERLPGTSRHLIEPGWHRNPC